MADKILSNDELAIDTRVFVFGSNLAGVHGAGAALAAHRVKGAQIGEGIGRTGQSYAVPTKDHRIRTMPLEQIEPHVRVFLDYARNHPLEKFLVTRIGCGLAGYTDADMAPMFKEAPANCDLPEGWREWPVPAKASIAKALRVAGHNVVIVQDSGPNFADLVLKERYDLPLDPIIPSRKKSPRANRGPRNAPRKGRR